MPGDRQNRFQRRRERKASRTGPVEGRGSNAESGYRTVPVLSASAGVAPYLLVAVTSTRSE